MMALSGWTCHPTLRKGMGLWVYLGVWILNHSGVSILNRGFAQAFEYAQAFWIPNWV